MNSSCSSLSSQNSLNVNSRQGINNTIPSIFTTLVNSRSLLQANIITEFLYTYVFPHDFWHLIYLILCINSINNSSICSFTREGFFTDLIAKVIYWWKIPKKSKILFVCLFVCRETKKRHIVWIAISMTNHLYLNHIDLWMYFCFEKANRKYVCINMVE